MSIISTPYPFAVWGAGLIGPQPAGAKQAKYAVVAIDYFTRWVEAEPLTSITEANTTAFIKKNVVYRFGVPVAIITDLGKQFDNYNFRDYCKDLKIECRFTSVAHPQTNGLVESTNKTIKKLFKKKL